MTILLELSPSMRIPDLLDRLQSDRPSPSVLGDLLKRCDCALTHGVYANISSRLAQECHPIERDELIALVPRSLGEGPAETEKLIARIYRQLPDEVELPNWREADLAWSAQVEWGTTEIVRTPQMIEKLGDLARAVVESIDPTETRVPESYARSICATADPSVQIFAPQHIKRLLHRGLILPDVARQLFMDLTASQSAEVKAQALSALGEPWSVCFPCPKDVLKSLLNESESIAKYAVDTLSKWPRADLLWEIVTDAGRSRYLRRHVLRRLGAHGAPENIASVMAIADEDPYFLGPSAVVFLKELSQRGIAVSSDCVDALFELYLSCPAIPCDTLAEVLSPVTRRWIKCLEELPASDLSWQRQIDLLVSLDADEGVELLLERANDATFEPIHARCIAALAKLDCDKAEPLALEQLRGRKTASTLAALERIGGDQTRNALWNHLDEIESLGELDRNDALELALKIEENLFEALQSVDGADASESTIRVLAVATPQHFEEHLIGVAEDAHHPERRRAIDQLGKSCGASALNPLGRLLLDEDEDLRLAVSASIKQIGGRLFDAGCRRPRVLCLARSTSEAGDFVLAFCIQMLLTDPGRTIEELSLLLGQLVGHRLPRPARYLHRFLNHKNVDVRKHAIACLTSSNDSKLAARVVEFLKDDNIFTARQALIALGKMKATWCDQEISALLDHPNMNIKKAAAEALAGAGGPNAVPQLIDWIARHDNPGLRDLLVAALKRVLGDGYVCTLMSALSNRSEPQEVRHLILALNDQLEIPTVLEAVRRKATWSQELMGMLRSSDFRLAYGESVSTLENEAERLNVELPRGQPENVRPQVKPGEIEQRLNEFLEGDEGTSGGDLEFERLTATQRRALRGALPRILDLLTMSSTRPKAIRSLKVILPELSEGELVVVAEAIRDGLRNDRIPLEEAFAILSDCEGTCPSELAWRGVSSKSSETRNWAIQVLAQQHALDLDTTVVALSQTRDPSNRRHLLEYAMRQGWYAEVLQVAVETTPHFIEEVRSKWSVPAADSHANSKLILAGISAAQSADAIEALLDWLSETHGSNVDEFFIKYLEAKNHRYRDLAVRALQSRPSTTIEETLVGLVTGDSQGRQAAAEVLLAWPGCPQQDFIVERFIRGDLRDISSLRPTVQHLQPYLIQDFDQDGSKRIIQLLQRARSEAGERLSALLPLWRNDHADVSSVAADAIRGLPYTTILSFVSSKLSEGKVGYLDLLPSRANVSPVLISFLESSDPTVREEVLRHLRGVGPAASMRGRGLQRALTTIAQSAPSATSLCLIGRLSSWKQPNEREELIRLLAPLLDHPSFGSAAVEALLAGIQPLATRDQIDILGKLGKISSHEWLVPYLTRLVIQAPSLSDRLPATWRNAIRQQCIEFCRSRDVDIAKQALRSIVTDGHELMLEVVEEALGHPSSRIRVLAHRLLRQHAPMERYLEATLQLLDDRVVEIQRGAIRTLAYRVHLPAVPKIAELLHVKKRKLNDTARSGLITMGHAALPGLRRAASHARPDRRRVVEEVIAEIEELPVSR